MSRFAILSDEVVGEEKSKDKKTSNPKQAVKAAVAAPAAPVETAQKPKKEKKADAPASTGDKEEKEYKKDNSKREGKRNDNKKPGEAGDRPKKDPKAKTNKAAPGDPEGRPEARARRAEKAAEAVAAAAVESADAASDAGSVEAPATPAEPPKKSFADAQAELEAARAALLQPKEGRKADAVKGTVVVNDETKDAAARFFNANAATKEAPKAEKKTKKIFEDVQFGTGDKGTPRVFTPSAAPRAGDRKGKPNANDFGPALSATLGKK